MRQVKDVLFAETRTDCTKKRLKKKKVLHSHTLLPMNPNPVTAWTPKSSLLALF